MMPQKTLSLKETMVVALWNNKIIKNPRNLKKKNLNYDMVLLKEKK